MELIFYQLLAGFTFWWGFNFWHSGLQKNAFLQCFSLVTWGCIKTVNEWLLQFTKETNLIRSMLKEISLSFTTSFYSIPPNKVTKASDIQHEFWGQEYGAFIQVIVNNKIHRYITHQNVVKLKYNLQTLSIVIKSYV